METQPPRRLRIHLTTRAVIAITFALLALVAVSAMWQMRAPTSERPLASTVSPPSQPTTDPPPSPQAEGAAVSEATSDPNGVVVYVTGAVTTPGL